MKRAFPLLAVSIAFAIALADDAPLPEHGEAVAKIAVPGMECDGSCPPTVKNSLDGPGIKEVKVDFNGRSATLRYEAEKTRATDALARLTRMKAYSTSTVASVEALFETDYAKAQASADVKKKGQKGKLHLVLEPRSGHTFNSEKESPDLEVEVRFAPSGVKVKDPLVKVKGGLKASRAFDFELDVAAKAHAGEETATVEIRLQDVKGQEKKPHVIDLAVPILIP